MEQSFRSAIGTKEEIKALNNYDLAALNEVETRALKQSVKRNLIRFPEDFMFQLTKNEWTEVITICDNLPRNIKFSPSTPYAFREQGVAMLSSILNSDGAIIRALTTCNFKNRN